MLDTPIKRHSETPSDSGNGGQNNSEAFNHLFSELHRVESIGVTIEMV